MLFTKQITAFYNVTTRFGVRVSHNQPNCKICMENILDVLSFFLKQQIFIFCTHFFFAFSAIKAFSWLEHVATMLNKEIPFINYLG
jgi:hypothetical protein